MNKNIFKIGNLCLFTGLNVVDYYLTEKILSYGGKEVNPIVNKFGLIPAKILGVSSASIISYSPAWKIVIPLNITMFGVCVWNFFQIKKGKK